MTAVFTSITAVLKWLFFAVLKQFITAVMQITVAWFLMCIKDPYLLPEFSSISLQDFLTHEPKEVYFKYGWMFFLIIGINLIILWCYGVVKPQAFKLHKWILKNMPKDLIKKHRLRKVAYGHFWKSPGHLWRNSFFMKHSEYSASLYVFAFMLPWIVMFVVTTYAKVVPPIYTNKYAVEVVLRTEWPQSSAFVHLCHFCLWSSQLVISGCKFAIGYSSGGLKFWTAPFIGAALIHKASQMWRFCAYKFPLFVSKYYSMS